MERLFVNGSERFDIISGSFVSDKTDIIRSSQHVKYHRTTIKYLITVDQTLNEENHLSFYNWSHYFWEAIEGSKLYPEIVPSFA